MARVLKLTAQGLALAGVAGLLVLLVWKVTHHPGAKLNAAIAHGKKPAAPNFDLPRLDGRGRVSLASLRGKAVIVNFWASWCAPCKREAPELERSWKAHSGQGLVVLGIDANDVSGDARHFARKLGLTYPLVHAPTTIWDDWGVTGVPETFFVDRRGRLVDVHVAGPVLDGGNKALFERGIRLALKS